jgi:hypothetical protein
MEDVITRYMNDVTSRDYPAAKETVFMDKEEVRKFAKDMNWDAKLEELEKGEAAE